MMSTAGFTLASFLCGAAPNLASLVIFRIIQGATGGALQPLSQAVLLESFKPEERGKAMGFWGLGIVCAPILGPVVGGWLTENYSWRWVFYINLPFGIISLLMTRRLRLRSAVPRSATRRGSTTGAWACWWSASARCSTCSTRASRTTGSRTRPSRCSPIVSAVTLTALVVQQLLSKNPIVDLRLFKDRSYAVGVFLMTVLGFVLYGSLVLLPVMLQTLFGFSSYQAGQAMVPRGVGSLVMMPTVGILTGLIDPRKLLVDRA